MQLLFFSVFFVGLIPCVDPSDGVPELHALSGSGVHCIEKAGDGKKGRGLVALRHFSSGSRIFCEDPYVFSTTVSDEAHIERSHFNLKLPRRPHDLVRCEGCQFARYASGEEQRLAWPVHMDECRRIARCIHHGHTPSPILLILARILARKRREREKRMLQGERDTYAHVLALADRYGEWPVDQMAMFAQVCIHVAHLGVRLSLHR